MINSVRMLLYLAALVLLLVISSIPVLAQYAAHLDYEFIRQGWTFGINAPVVCASILLELGLIIVFIACVVKANSNRSMAV